MALLKYYKMKKYIFLLTLITAFSLSLFAGGPEVINQFNTTDCSHSEPLSWQSQIEQNTPTETPVLKSQVENNPFDAIKIIVDAVRSGAWMDILGMESILIGLLTLIIGWFSDKIPFLEKIGNTEIRVFAIALIIILTFSIGGFAPAVINGVVGYLGANRAYALIIKVLFNLFKKDSKPDHNVNVA